MALPDQIGGEVELSSVYGLSVRQKGRDDLFGDFDAVVGRVHGLARHHLLEASSIRALETVARWRASKMIGLLDVFRCGGTLASSHLGQAPAAFEGADRGNGPSGGAGSSKANRAQLIS